MQQPDRSHETGEAHAAGQAGAGGVKAGRPPTEQVIIGSSLAQSMGFHYYDRPKQGVFVTKVPKANPC